MVEMTVWPWRRNWNEEAELKAVVMSPACVDSHLRAVFLELSDNNCFYNMFPVHFVSRSLSKMTSASLSCLSCSFILEPFLYQGSLNENKNRQDKPVFFLFHSKHGHVHCQGCRSAASLRHWKGQIGKVEMLHVDLTPVVLWLRMLAFEHVKMFLADAKPFYLQFITYESSPSIQCALYNCIV